MNKQVELKSRMPETYIFKSVGDCEIKADVYGGSPGDVPRPVVLMFHGGALIIGGREWVDEDLCGRLMDSGFVVVSADYRLAPETKLSDIIEDVNDAYRWVREQGQELFGADPNRIGVQGFSAGGYLTLMTGFCVEPRPKALVSISGYGDIICDWYTKPDPFYCTRPRVSDEDARSAVGEGVPCGNPQGKRRGDFYLYCRQNGLWPKEVTGFDPETEGAASRRFCPVLNVTADYPPTFLYHGDNDTDVPYSQSVQMAGALAAASVPHEFVPLQGGGHGINSSTPEGQRVIERAVEFLVHYVKAGIGSRGE